MVLDRICKYITIVGICSIAFAWGCAEQEKTKQQAETAKAVTEKAAKPAVKPEAGKAAGVKIALKLKPDEQNSYQLSIKMHRSIEWQGPLPKKDAFEENYNDEQMVMVFTQRIQSVDANGKASAKVTIDKLKYLSVVKKLTSVDFDSSRASDANNPLAKLVGQSYTIELGPEDLVYSVSGLAAAQAMMNGRTAADRAGLTVLSADAITERHSAFMLPKQGSEMLRPGGTWSRIKTFSFGLMGLKSYEKIYTLNQIRDVAGRQIAVIDMNAIPSSEIEPKYSNQKAGAEFPKMFDANDIFNGKGEFDLAAGRIENYSENLQANWTAALPSALGGLGDANEPVVLKMAASRVYNLERVK